VAGLPKEADIISYSPRAQIDDLLSRAHKRRSASTTIKGLAAAKMVAN